MQFKLLLPDLHTGFSRGKSGGLVLINIVERMDRCVDGLIRA